MIKPVLAVILLWPVILAVASASFLYSRWAANTSGEIVLEESPFCPFS
ncbi:hypothetical protein ABEG18_06920 [Alsobacter sp. KACC 23698]|uniref:Uncharacterized protein n=1 Tax=Alsobacter sp. KACC 23698 TaxID=3149229 RepID=A0AAU7JJY5_9HYPH